MIIQSAIELSPKIRFTAIGEQEYKSVEGIDILEVTEETSARIAKHAGESSQVYADTRVRQPARYRAQIVVRADNHDIRATSAFAEDGFTLLMTPELRNLLDASAPEPAVYAVTSLFTTCYNMMVVSSRRRDTNDTRGLRIQDVVFEECILAGGQSDDENLFKIVAEDETDTAYDGYPIQEIEEDPEYLPEEEEDGFDESQELGE